MDNYYVSKLLPLIAESGICAIANPLINLTLQGRHDTYPRRRGMTRIAEMRALGIPVALGQDCVMDPWYGLGGADMLDVAHMAVHGAPMTSREAIRWTFDAVTKIPARILGLEGYGLAVGAHADMVLLQAADPIEAVRLRATRLLVIRRGKVIARTAPRRPSFRLREGPRVSIRRPTRRKRRSRRPHPEETRRARRLEGWSTRRRGVRARTRASFETPADAGPQDEVAVCFAQNARRVSSLTNSPRSASASDWSKEASSSALMAIGGRSFSWASCKTIRASASWASGGRLRTVSTACSKSLVMREA